MIKDSPIFSHDDKVFWKRFLSNIYNHQEAFTKYETVKYPIAVIAVSTL